MTGQKDRYSTTEKLWKIDDEQLTTPKHDELVLMWFNKEFAASKLLEYFPGLPSGYEWEIVSIKSECPIKNAGFIIGYWDIVIEVKTKYCDVLNNNNSVFSEFFKFCPRYFFIECKPSIQSFGQTLQQINTYNSHLIRACDRDAEWFDNNNLNHKITILFTPDTRFEDAFESQGIRVISP